MFLQELTPIFRELAQQPAAFLGGFCAGVLRLKLSEDPLKSWLQHQGVTPTDSTSSDTGDGPQSISIE